MSVESDLRAQVNAASREFERIHDFMRVWLEQADSGGVDDDFLQKLITFWGKF